MSHLERRANFWHVVLTIPKDVRPKLSVNIRFLKSTGIADKRVAQSSSYALVAEWKDQIARARGSEKEEGSFLDGVLEYCQQLEDLQRSGQRLHHEVLSSAILEKAEKLDTQGQAEDARRLAGVVLGQETPIESEFQEWRDGLHFKPKTAEQMEKDAKRMAAHFEVIGPESVREWAKVLMAPKDQDGYGYGVSSVKRCFSGPKCLAPPPREEAGEALRPWVSYWPL